MGSARSWLRPREEGITCERYLSARSMFFI